MNKQTSNITFSKPKQWKKLIITFLFVYIFVNIFYFLVGDFLAQLPLLLRTFIIAGIFVPIFGKAIPFMHNLFYKWTIK